MKIYLVYGRDSVGDGSGEILAAFSTEVAAKEYLKDITEDMATIFRDKYGVGEMELDKPNPALRIVV